MTFHEAFCELCSSRHIAPTAAAIEAGLSKALVSKWKNNPDTIPNGETLTKVANYFNISVSDLLALVNGCTATTGDNLSEAKRIAMSLNQEDLFDLQKAVMTRIMELSKQKN